VVITDLSYHHSISFYLPKRSVGDSEGIPLYRL
jgi:hypothetical protein